MNEKIPECICEVKDAVWHSASCLANQLDTERAAADELRKSKLPPYLTEPYNKAVVELSAMRLFAKKAVVAIQDIKNELGVPQPDYPAPVANACYYADVILTDPMAREIMKEKV